MAGATTARSPSSSSWPTAAAQPTLVPGNWGVRDLLAMVDVPSPDALVGQRLSVMLADMSVATPAVTRLLGAAVPDSFRRAFDEGAEPPAPSA